MTKKVQVKGAVRVGRKKRGIVFWTKPSKLSIILSSLAVFLIVTGLTMGGIPVIWMVWYRLSPGTSTALAEVLRRPIIGFDQVLTTEEMPVTQVVAYQPPVDKSLPPENRLMVPKIGIDTEIIEQPIERYEEAFKVGVWRVPDFGDAFKRDKPMILVAHRFGYLAWTNQYRRENSFFNLPKLETGDRIEVIWNQRKYVYEIYAGEEGEQITQYTADLILYTCKFIESDIRIFRYARLIEQ